MGLSYLSNSLSTELPQELLGLEDYLLQDDFTSDISIDSLFQQQQQPTFISQPYDDNSSQLLLADNPNKRQKTACHYQYQDDVSNVRYDDVLISATDPFFEGCYGGGGCTGGLPFAPPVFESGASERSGGRGGLSAQSIAARKRRRKIADKTQELGKLIPGGHRMNTAEMFQSAAMYVKFLQAQIGIISLSNSLLVSSRQNGGSCYDDDDDDEEQRDLEILAASPVVQEKLYSQEKCLVPMKLVQALSSDSKLQSEQHAVAKQVNNLLMTRAN